MSQKSAFDFIGKKIGFVEFSFPTLQNTKNETQKQTI